MKIDLKTSIFGIVGYPLGHSLSPLMHNTAFRFRGLNAIYLFFETQEIENAIKGIKALGIKGVSVTIPYKSDVLPFLDRIDSLAENIGAVNTIINKEGELIGYNTDAIGALKAIKERISPIGKGALIIGAGGAARSIGYMLKKEGADLFIASRNYRHAKKLAESLGGTGIPMEDIGSLNVDILINATPVGMYPHTDRCPVSASVLRPGMVVMDIVYNPLDTLLLKIAKDRRCITINGLKMFIYQGAEQFRLWTGLEPPLDTMEKAVRSVLENDL